MPAWLWAAVAAVAGVTMEAIYKKTAMGLLDWRMIAMMLGAQLTIGPAIYHLVKTSDNLIAATILFSSSTLAIRVALTVYWGDAVPTGTWIGLALMIAARLSTALL